LKDRLKRYPVFKNQSPARPSKDGEFDSIPAVAFSHCAKQNSLLKVGVASSKSVVSMLVLVYCPPPQLFARRVPAVADPGEYRDQRCQVRAITF